MDMRWGFEMWMLLTASLGQRWVFTYGTVAVQITTKDNVEARVTTQS